MVLIHAHLSRLVFADVPPPYELHQRLWRAFDADERPFLHRADRAAHSARQLVVLVQSTTKADWSRVGDKLESAENKEVDIRLAEGEVFRFFLRANPTIARKGRNEPKFAGIEGDAFRTARGRRVAIWSEEDRLAWLCRKGETHGFSLLGPSREAPAVRISNARVTSWTRKGNAARHDGVDFEGLMRVEDPAKLGEAIRGGIGSAKAFGFGLLSLARP